MKTVLPVIKYLRKFLNFVSHRDIAVLDTGVLVSADGSSKRAERLPRFLGQPFITEFVKDEKRKRLQKGDIEIFHQKTTVLDFESLRTRLPDACVLFFNFLVGTHNPALITNPYFLNEALINLKKMGQKLTEAQEKVNILLSNMMAGSAQSTVTQKGDKKLEAAEILDKAYQRHIKKKRKANINYDNYLNDYKSLSLSIVDCLERKSNTTFVTTDSDILIATCNFIESVAQHTAFKHVILERIKQEGVIRLWKGKEKFRFSINFDDFATEVKSLINNMFALNLWSPSFSFDVIFWDQKQEKYIKIFELHFDEEIRDLLLHLHGQVACPFVRNCDYGNMLKYKYELTKDMKLNIEVSPKDLRNAHYTDATSNQHQEKCQLVHRLRQGNFEYFTEFEPSGLPPLFDR